LSQELSTYAQLHAFDEASLQMKTVEG
jgi:hypothetical protein